jgi:hypothetical protein
MRVHRDQADLLHTFGVAQALDNARAGQLMAAEPGDIEPHQLAIVGIVVLTRINAPVFQLFAVDRPDRAAAASALFINAEQPPLLALEPADDAGTMVINADWRLQHLDIAQDAIANARRRRLAR